MLYCYAEIEYETIFDFRRNNKSNDHKKENSAKRIKLLYIILCILHDCKNIVFFFLMSIDNRVTPWPAIHAIVPLFARAVKTWSNTRFKMRLGERRTETIVIRWQRRNSQSG